jgi:phosphoglycerate dehydrogenase-like enzyme
LLDVTVCVPLSATQQARLTSYAEGCTVGFQNDTLPIDSAVVFGNPTPQAVAANQSLRWLQLESVGFGEYAALDWMRGPGIVQVTNLAGFFAEPVAQSALAGILACHRGIARLAVLKERSEWVGDPIRAEIGLLTRAKVVLFGFGAINRRLAELMAPFRCAISAFSSTATSAALDAALAEADVVVATVPDTPSMRGLFDAARIARIRRGAIFCNFGRGSLIDEAALATALRSGLLGGAVIDVTRAEPLPSEHPFWSCPNTILTQHTGGGTVDEVDRKVDVFLANLARFRSGAPLYGLVDFSKGY